jgi:putative membrane-bound dehydrogenase-like protein
MIRCFFLMLLSASMAGGAERYTLHSFRKIQLSDQFFGEGANFGDFNRDGAMDLVSGPYWYAGPQYTERHEYYPAQPFDINGYSKNFFAFAHDVNGDGWTDIVIVGFPGEESWWFANPQGKSGHWQRRVIMSVVDNESPTFTDISGDGKPELVCSTGGRLGYAEIPSDPSQIWKFRPITPVRGYQRFTHGLGVGDVNGDGRQDLLEKDGWWEQPSGGKEEGARSEQSAGGQSESTWAFHEFSFSQPGGAQMYAFDVEGDGDNDVVTSKAAHAYGLAWFENVADDDGQITFKEHLIMGERPEQNEYGVAFSQLHAVALADMNGDGVPDIVTGKRFWAHNGNDPGERDPAVLYWFETVRENGGARFVPHRIDIDSGVGTQVVTGDLNSDQLPDIVVGSKKGTFAFVHQADEVDRETWERAQPAPTAAEKPAAAARRQVEKSNASNEAIPAAAADGRVLNLDFETGDLRDWTSDGTAFEGQPVEGDTVHARRSDSFSGHEGRFWIGTFERKGDGPQGTLTSVKFPVTQPYASFLIGGGAGQALQAEIVLADTSEVVFRASGRSQEEMRPVVADLRKFIGKQIFIRLVDHAGTGWAHINFDHFRFHARKPVFSAARKSKVHELDEYPYAGLPAEEAARVMKLPPGFSVTVAAAEPDVKQPIAMALDDRGRVWVAEAYEYPVRAPEGKGRDRILVFEDVDGDGRFDKRKVFADRLNLVSGLEVGFGGVWVGAAPYLLFIPDRDGDDVPDGEPEILLDGWAWQDTHETLNTFIWGPDGWLYGCHGVFTHSRVGKPGTPDAERVPLNAAIWRYHPTRHVFEVFAEGTSNPWGVDFDDYGQAFCTACVIPHLYHVIPGARYQRQAGNHFNPYTYADIRTIADHVHYLGGSSHARNDSSGAAGGGHAHSGAMVYLGGAWPDEYRGRIFMNNIHGQRLNTDILTPSGSGFVGSHGPDFLLTGDLASQILNIRYGPDGNAYLIDWYDTNACHHTNVEGHDRSNGRICKVAYRVGSHAESTAARVDLTKLTDRQLAELVLEKNDWYVRHARRLLQERAAAGGIDKEARARLAELAVSHPNPARQLRAMWALHGIGTSPEVLTRCVLDGDDRVIAWAIRLIAENVQAASEPWRSWSAREWVPLLERTSRIDPTSAVGKYNSPIVRLAIACVAQRLAPADRWSILEALTSHAEDAGDHNLPLMYWYAAEPLADADPQRALKLGLSCGQTIPQLQDFMLRRIGSLKRDAGLPVLIGVLSRPIDDVQRLAILQAIRTALSGRRHVEPPDEWHVVYNELAHSSHERVRAEATALGVTFGDHEAVASLRALAVSPAANETSRLDALNSLLAAKDAGLAATLQALLKEPALREAALAGLALYDDPQTPPKLLTIYSSLSPREKRTALATLASRAPYATALLRAVGEKHIPATDLPADLVRQLHNLDDDAVNDMLAKIWGQVRSTAADKAQLIAQYRQLITNAPESDADLQLGRAVFAKTCQQCHTLYGVGDKIAPDLTGSNRADLEYLLSNVIDPGALIAKEYQSTIIITVDGRVVTGIVSAEDDKALSVRTATETLVIPRDEIDERELTATSLMPDDQLKQFTPREVVSLFAYLRGKSQVPMLATKENAGLLFNGRNLAGWTGDSQLWSVENGEIVGRSPGIDHNSFLISDLSADDFRLSLEAKLANDSGNSGVQFRSESLEGFHELRGYQADIGPDWWGKLYEENGRALLWDKSGEEHVKRGEWNRYEIEAVGSRVRTWINGQACVDLDDPSGKRRGIFALQLHAGGPMEVRFRNLQLEVK